MNRRPSGSRFIPCLAALLAMAPGAVHAISYPARPHFAADSFWYTPIPRQVSLNPNSEDALVSLAQACEKNGQKELAIRSYKRALEMDPSNETVKTRLAGLQ